MKSKKIIGVCGFTYTGSSAYTDFLKEFEENEVLDEFEFPISYFPDGIEDLDYQLNYKDSKYYSAVAFKRFEKTANFLLKKQIKSRRRRKDIINNYLNSLIQARWRGFGSANFVLYNQIWYKYVHRYFGNLYIRILGLFKIYPNYFPSIEMRFASKPDNFQTESKKFVEQILNQVVKTDKLNLVLDQPFVGSNPKQSMKYFNEAKAIVVDRDPRDLFLYIKNKEQHIGRQTPVKSVEDFVEFYKNMRKSIRLKEKKGEILHVYFEDLIYKYDITKLKLMNFLDIKQHKSQFKYFNPKDSLVNTKLYENNIKDKKSIEYIENHLKDYLYNL